MHAVFFLPTGLSCYAVINFGGGTVAGGVASIVSHPLDVIRTRFVGQGEPKVIFVLTVYKYVLCMYNT